MSQEYSDDYSETLKFKNFDIILERELDGEFHLDIYADADRFFTSFRFSIEDIQDILNEIENFHSDSNVIYEALSLESVFMRQEDEPPSLEILTDKTFSILCFADDDEVVRFQSELIKACD